jgi:hypothetical protein
MSTCVKCAQDIDESDEYKHTPDQTRKICSVCVTQYLFRCDKCHEYYEKRERHLLELGMDLDDTLYYCNECWSDR